MGAGSKALGDLRSVLSDAAGADNAHGPALEVEPVQTFEGEVAPARAVDSVHQVMADRGQQCEYMLGDSCCRHRLARWRL